MKGCQSHFQSLNHDADEENTKKKKKLLPNCHHFSFSGAENIDKSVVKVHLLLQRLRVGLVIPPNGYSQKHILRRIKELYI
jgi:hypothetical protein